MRPKRRAMLLRVSESDPAMPHFYDTRIRELALELRRMIRERHLDRLRVCNAHPKSAETRARMSAAMKRRAAENPEMQARAVAAMLAGRRKGRAAS